MPSTVAELFATAGLEPHGPVPWGTPVPETAQGVYVVALTDVTTSSGGVVTPPLDRAALGHLLQVRPELRINQTVPDAHALADRLSRFWLPDEVVLYVGLAGQPLRTRVRQYYRTPLGAKRPHAGGWWLKTLRVLDELWVYWAATAHYALAEQAMLHAFADAVSPETRRRLLNDEAVMPFANLRGWDDRVKSHRITGATGDLPTASARSPTRTLRQNVSPNARSAHASPRPAAPPPGDTSTQRITAKDFEAGRIRVPSRTKELLPLHRRDTTVVLRGIELRARWDPRMGPPERSGVLAFGRGRLDGLVEADEVLAARVSANGQLELQ
jgi:hypothetical protein